MSFTITLRQGPARLAARVPQISQTVAKPITNPSSLAARAFHQSARRQNAFFTSKTAPLLRPTTSTSLTLGRLAGRRGYQYQAGPVPTDNSSAMRKIAVGGAIFGGTMLAINIMFNRETREDGGMPDYERSYLNDTFLHTGLGIGIIAVTARQMIQSGFTYRLMVTNPWVVGLGGLALSIGTMMGTRMIEPDNYIPKYALWTAFNATQAAVISPLLAFAPGALLARAGLYTVAMMGSISFVGATAKQEKYLYLGGPLLAGAGIVMASGLAPLVIPATAVRTLAFTENLWLWGGLAVFGGFTLWDVQKVLHHARLAERGIIKKDAVNESISLELDFLNIFIRMVQILMMQQNRRK